MERQIGMFCPKCGKGIPADAAFCMHCGQKIQIPQPVAAQPMLQSAPAFPNPTAANPKKTTWIAIGTALAMLLAIFFGLKASGFLQFGAKNPKLESLKAKGNVPNQDLLKAEGSANGPDLLKAEGSQPPPILNRTAERIEMPDDIRRWLEHLEKIERRKNDLSLKQLSQMAILMQQMKVLGGGMGLLNGEDEGGDTGPSQTAKVSFDAMRPEWNQLIADFRNYPPPAECRPIADDYYRAVSEIPGMNSDLAAILEGAMNDPAVALEKALKIQNT
ncbi:MAG: zinc ribbon domain-containing protein, partial [Chlorobia bacterium]|nr:zinc ribbon domain-containing protein [Fimbriimonadaceae bacterium]